MKAPFRFFRSEFMKGVYLKHLVLIPNKVVQNVLDELVYHTLVQFKNGDEVDSGEVQIRDDDILNYGKIAGLFQPRVRTLTTAGSIHFSTSFIVEGQERSERGLMDMDIEKMAYYHVYNDDYPEDIINEANADFRSTFVPEGTQPIGYLPYGVDLYTSEGDVIWSNLLSVPPTDGTPYTNYYGEQYLVFNEYFDKEILLPISVFKLLLECVQRIRYNGPSVVEFLTITRILLDNYVYKIEITPSGSHYVVEYERNDDIDLDDRKSKYAAWQNICEQKFKHFVLVDREA